MERGQSRLRNCPFILYLTLNTGEKGANGSKCAVSGSIRTYTVVGEAYPVETAYYAVVRKLIR